MKYLFFFIVGMLLPNLYSQSCLPNGINFLSQAQLDSFTILYPDCTEILGDVFLEKNNITSLDSLYKIRRIGGDLKINQLNITTLQGLDQLQEIGGSFKLIYCRNLKSLKSLSNLKSIGVDLIILDPFDLKDLSGLEGITTINNELTLRTTVLPSLEGLHNIIEIGKSLNLTISNLNDYYGLRGLKTIRERGLLIAYTNLKDLKGFTSLEKLHDLTIHSPEVVSLNGLENLKEVTGIITLDCESLEDISQLDNIKTVGGLFIHDCVKLDNLHGLENLEYINDFGLYIANLPKLRSLHELSNLKHINLGMKILFMDNLETLYGLHNLAHLDSVKFDDFYRWMVFRGNKNLSICNLDNICEYLTDGGSATIIDNGQSCGSIDEVINACNTNSCPLGDIYFTTQSQVDSFPILYPDCHSIFGSLIISGSSIRNLESLQHIERIYGNLTIADNNNLQGVSGFDSLKLLTGSLEIIGNDNITDVSSFGQIITIDGDLILRDNAKLSRIQGLQNIKNIWGNLYLDENESLMNLGWLASLRNVEKNIEITNNASLVSLTGLDGLSAYYVDSIKVMYNDNLSFCAIEPVCERFTYTFADRFFQNAGGCDSKLEVEEFCYSSDGFTVNSNEEIFIIPNPSQGDLFIYDPMAYYKVDKVEVYNTMGLEVGEYRPVNNQFNISNLPSGLFLINLISNNRPIKLVKIIKVD